MLIALSFNAIEPTMYGASSFLDAVAFGLMILILFIRPQGLFAKAGKGGRP